MSANTRPNGSEKNHIPAAAEGSPCLCPCGGREMCPNHDRHRASQTMVAMRHREAEPDRQTSANEGD
jgi:hypothetical protein